MSHRPSWAGDLSDLGQKIPMGRWSAIVKGTILNDRSDWSDWPAGCSVDSRRRSHDDDAAAQR
jgi:hypothetical protein